MAILAITMVVAFLAAVAAVMALGMAFRDFSTRRQHLIDRRLGLDTRDTGEIEYTPPEEQTYGRIDKWFIEIVEQSGVSFDVTSAMALVIGCAVVGCAIPLVLMENLLMAAVGLVVGVALPIGMLAGKRWWRNRAMQRELPEALQIVADGVRSGHNLQESAELVASEMKGPLSSEFENCASQLQLGNSPVSVFSQMARRIPLQEFQIFATAVMVHHHAGGNLSLLSERMSHSARERQEFMGHLNAVTAGSRLSAVGMVLGSVAAMVSLAWLNPEYISAFLYNDLGPALLLTAIALQTVGAIWVWQILKVKF